MIRIQLCLCPSRSFHPHTHQSFTLFFFSCKFPFFHVIFASSTSFPCIYLFSFFSFVLCFSLFSFLGQVEHKIMIIDIKKKSRLVKHGKVFLCCLCPHGGQFQSGRTRGEGVASYRSGCSVMWEDSDKSPRPNPPDSQSVNISPT